MAGAVRRPNRWCTCGRTQQASEDWAKTSSLTTANGVVIVRCPSCGFDTTVRTQHSMLMESCPGAWHRDDAWHYDDRCQTCADRVGPPDRMTEKEAEAWLST